ncbi:MAG: tRNA (cytidine(56)-2'-O)-methyltransferase [Thermoprotei archaeon]|nr:tRNA (cytidine(56)-2'-O)-methyltransferase [Thermoprotei archaeon]
MDPGSAYSKVYVLRLGHRPARDKRITTHVGLVARAFGANGFILEGVCDEVVFESLRKTLRMWGGSMVLECGVNGEEYVREWRSSGGEVIHLTMYGLNMEDVIDAIRVSTRPKLIVVGAGKVEGFYYEASDYNVAVGNQPHSEVSALAVFLDRLFRGRWTNIIFEGARLKIIPQSRGKMVVNIGDRI